MKKIYLFLLAVLFSFIGFSQTKLQSPAEFLGYELELLELPGGVSTLFNP